MSVIEAKRTAEHSHQTFFVEILQHGFVLEQRCRCLIRGITCFNKTNTLA